MSGLGKILIFCIFGCILLSEARFSRSSMRGGPSKVSSEIQIQPPENYNGSKFFELPLDQAVERQLQADLTFNGFYLMPSNKKIKFFSSVDVKPTEFVWDYEIFRHTPDICWIKAGWVRLETDMTRWKLKIDDKDIVFHRRTYSSGDRTELCYFAFLVEGKNYKEWERIFVQEQTKFQNPSVLLQYSNYILNYYLNQLGVVMSEIFRSDHSLANHAQFLRISTEANKDMPVADEAIQKFLQNYFKQINNFN